MPYDPIKHSHYHMGHSQSANVIVDVETGPDGGALLLGSDVKANHICSNSMQMSNRDGVGGGSVAQTKLPLTDIYATSQKNNRGCSNNGGQQPATGEHHLVQTIPIKSQPTQQTAPMQQHFGRNNAQQQQPFSAVGLMTLPKGGLLQQQATHLGYNNRNDCATLPRNLNGSNLGRIERF